MKRINVHLEERQIKELKEYFKETGTRPAESIRRAIDLFLAGKKKIHKQIK
jgi:hypothetical protein